jgi:exopolyphosphatase/guanosine-5'-triphosphate,3'-diphosphate pyrophosphatase
MPNLCSIDVGSNAMRLAIGFLDQHKKLHLVEDMREPVRLGQDVFTQGVISKETIQKAVEAFLRFKELIHQHQVVLTRAVATSAVREAHNRDELIARIQEATGIELRPITGEEEALLVYLAVSQKIPLQNKTSMLIDIGGGSVELTLAREGKILATDSFKMGAVRLLQVLEQKKVGERRFNQMVQEYVESASKRFNQKLAGQRINICAGTGGNLDALLSLKSQILHKPSSLFVTLGELQAILARIRSLTYEERVGRLGLRPDRADVILPAATVLLKVLEVAKMGRIYIPNVGVKEGLLIEMVTELLTGKRPLHRQEVVGALRQVGLKYAYDEAHAAAVTKLALELFDATHGLHGLGDDERLILEVAAQLHDIGQFINYGSHHKHSYYLIKATQLVGLHSDQVEVIANVARYHRKACPKIEHENYRALTSAQRQVVNKLAAILRLADAMDHEHSSKVTGFTLDKKGKRFTLRLKGKGDLLLERWALLRKRDLFEKVFRGHLTVQGKGAKD